MRFGAVLSLILLMAPLRPAPWTTSRPMLLATSVSIETISKSDDDVVALEVSIHASQDQLVATKRPFKGEWYEGSSFEAILDAVPHVLKSDFVGGDVILTPSRPLSQDWTYHCYVTFVFTDRSVINIGWRDVKLKAGARSVTHTWTVANCLPGEERGPGDHSNCALQMTFKGASGTQFAQ
jgi:hypothetical protein